MRSVIAAFLLTSLVAGSASAATLTDVERQRLLAHLDMTEHWLVDEVSKLSPAQLAFRPSPQSWTILEVVEHLVVVGPIYWQDLRAAMNSAPGGRSSTWTDADILWYGIDRTHRDKAIPTEEPRRNLRDVTAGLDAIRKAHAQLADYIKTTRDDLRSRIVPRQGCDAYQWALMISTHEQRHTLQIREIKASPGFTNR
jgi:DinB superfamily